VPVATISVSNSFQQSLDRFFGYLPNVLGFIVILAVGYIIARVIKKILDKVLEKLRIDEALQKSHAGEYVEKISPGGRPSRFIGGLVFWLIMLFVLTAAIGALKIPSVTTFMNQVLAYLPNVVVAVIIFVIAAAVSGAVASLASKTMGDTPTGKLAATIIPGLIMAIAVFMILTQLKVATTIVTITYAALLGMLALAGALAFGLGGRDVAGQIWSQTYQRSQDAKAQAQRDLQTGKGRAQAQVAARTSSSQVQSAPAGATAQPVPPWTDR
jgi:hypothetical protein